MENSDDRISEDDIKKLTFAELFRLTKRLTLGAILWVVGIQVTIIGLSYSLGVEWASKEASPEMTQEIIIKETLKKLNDNQRHLLKEFWRFQKKHNLNKVLTGRDGKMGGDTKDGRVFVNIGDTIIGTQQDPMAFENLLLSIPRTLIDFIPESNWDGNFTIYIPTKVGEEIEKIQ